MQENVSTLTILNEEREEQSEADEPEEENFPSALLEEKNQEIDHLNAEIQRLEQELDNTGDNKVRIHSHRILKDSMAAPLVDEKNALV